MNYPYFEYSNFTLVHNIVDVMCLFKKILVSSEPVTYCKVSATTNILFGKKLLWDTNFTCR